MPEDERARRETEVRKVAAAILDGKPLRSYVEGARLLARFVADHGLFFPGWKCGKCGVFNGEEKEPRVKCRSCDAAKGESA